MTFRLVQSKTRRRGLRLFFHGVHRGHDGPVLVAAQVDVRAEGLLPVGPAHQGAGVLDGAAQVARAVLEGLGEAGAAGAVDDDSKHWVILPYLDKTSIPPIVSEVKHDF